MFSQKKEKINEKNEMEPFEMHGTVLILSEKMKLGCWKWEFQFEAKLVTTVNETYLLESLK